MRLGSACGQRNPPAIHMSAGRDRTSGGLASKESQDVASFYHAGLSADVDVPVITPALCH